MAAPAEAQVDAEPRGYEDPEHLWDESRGANELDAQGWGVIAPQGPEGDELLGCGALKEIDPHHGEIKSMRTAETHLRRGVGTRILEHLIEEARRRSYRRLSLETGSMAAFEPARRLYARFGFEPCGPFADYRVDPNSIYMTMTL